MARRFRASVAEDPAVVAWTATWNAAPTHRLPVVIQDTARGRRLGLMKWGWQPAFMAGKVLVNARGEEAAGKRTFSNALRKRRCIVPATGFFEWQEAAKQPFAFSLAERGLFGIGGLWETLALPDGSRTGAFLLLTVPANPLVAAVHHRMPLILPADADDRWLSDGLADEEIQGLLAPLPAERMTSWRVGKAVNAVRNNSADLLTPIAD
jgi:putative SOS response-associated peptidase YedK